MFFPSWSFFSSNSSHAEHILGFILLFQHPLYQVFSLKNTHTSLPLTLHTLPQKMDKQEAPSLHEALSTHPIPPPQHRGPGCYRCRCCRREGRGFRCGDCRRRHCNRCGFRGGGGLHQLMGVQIFASKTVWFDASDYPVKTIDTWYIICMLSISNI